MVLVGDPGLYHFCGELVLVPASGEVEVSEDKVDAMKSAGFKAVQVRQSKKDKAPE